MTKEQLLIPRVMVIGTEQGKMNYPGSNFRTGEVLQMYGRWYERENKSPYVSIKASDVAKFPNCFKPLPWWYGRKPEDMPGYLRGSGGKGDVFFKVLQWRLCTDSLWQWINSTDGDTFYLQEYCTYQPSTSEEYEEFLKQKEGS